MGNTLHSLQLPNNTSINVDNCSDVGALNNAERSGTLFLHENANNASFDGGVGVTAASFDGVKAEVMGGVSLNFDEQVSSLGEHYVDKGKVFVMFLLR